MSRVTETGCYDKQFTPPTPLSTYPLTLKKVEMIVHFYRKWQTGALRTNTQGIPQFETCSKPVKGCFGGVLFIKGAGLWLFLCRRECDSQRHFTSSAVPPNTTLKGTQLSYVCINIVNFVTNNEAAHPQCNVVTEYEH